MTYVTAILTLYHGEPEQKSGETVLQRTRVGRTASTITSQGGNYQQRRRSPAHPHPPSSLSYPSPPSPKNSLSSPSPSRMPRRVSASTARPAAVTATATTAPSTTTTTTIVANSTTAEGSATAGPSSFKSLPLSPAQAGYSSATSASASASTSKLGDGTQATASRPRRIMPSRSRKGGPGVGISDVDTHILETLRRRRAFPSPPSSFHHPSHACSTL